MTGLTLDDKIQVTVVTNSRTISGVWLRNPFFKRYVDVYEDGEGSRFSATSALAFKGFFGLVHFFLNGPKLLRQHQKFVSQQDMAAGYTLLSLRSFVYFKREERSLEAEGYGLKVVSKGHNYMEERVAGHCANEYTCITRTLGDQRILWKGSSKRSQGYHLTYAHVVEKLLSDYSKSGRLEIETN